MNDSIESKASGLRTGRISWPITLASTAFVFSTAVVLRLPSCYESLWVDELHTSWSIWGEFSDVESRARIGNQTPYYFWFLWWWHQAAGSSELALRSSSVLLSAGACACLTAGIARIRRHLLLAVTVGLLLAVERNSVFFGTEFRGYAAIVILSAIMSLLVVKLHRRGGNKDRALLGIVSAMLFLVNFTTAIFVVALTICFVFASAHRKHRDSKHSGFLWTDMLLVLLAIGVAASIEHSAIRELWTRKEQWTAFAVPRGFNDFCRVWPWIPTVVVPGCIAIVAYVCTKRVRGRYWMPFLLSVVGTTAMIYFVSFEGIVAFWHRRYMVGLLPILVWGSAELWFAATRRFAKRWWSQALVAFCAVLLLMYSQRTIFFFSTPEKRQIAYRLEGWREAVAYVNENRESGKTVRIASGLIEARLLDVGSPEDIDPSFFEYLCCPVNNIYRVKGIRPISQQVLTTKSGSYLNEEDVVWLVARVPMSKAQSVVTEIQKGLISSSRAVSKESFGNVLVVRVGGKMDEEGLLKDGG